MIARALTTGMLIAILGVTWILIAMIGYSWITYGTEATANSLAGIASEMINTTLTMIGVTP